MLFKQFNFKWSDSHQAVATIGSDVVAVQVEI